MDAHKAELNAYEENVSARLHEAKAKLDEFEAHVKGKKADAEIQAINALKTKHHEIERKRQELRTAGEAKAGQVKAEIRAELAKLKTMSDQLASKMKTHAATT